MGLLDRVQVEVVPGVMAATGGAALLGAPLMHDFCLVSLSDLLTPWETIEGRLRAAAREGFVVCMSNPCSWNIAHSVGRPGESSRVLRLDELAHAEADMTSIVFVGNRTTRDIAGRMVTPRGYQVRP